VLLIIDNHSSHISYQAVRYCRGHHIEILTLPPHSTHKLQPLDVSFFSPLKSKYSYYLNKWLSERPGRKARISDIPAIFKPAFEDAAKEDTAKNGFSTTGIWQRNPVSGLWGPNKHCFDDEFEESESEHDMDDGDRDDGPPSPPPDIDDGDTDDRPPLPPPDIDGNDRDDSPPSQPPNPPFRGLPSGSADYQPRRPNSDPPSGPPRDQPLGLHSGLPSGPPRDQP
ncbi:unnamed protein product, partial [Allacma fusca]